jgi:hypothetical protein
MANATYTAGSNLILNNATPVKQTTPGSYIDFTTAGTAGWAQQYLPELYEAEIERYGDRSLSGFLQMVGAEMPMTSDQIIWSEQGRLHVSYEGVSSAADTGSAGSQVNVVTIPADANGNNHAIRANQTVVVSDGTTVFKALVSATTATTVTLQSYTTDGFGFTGATDVDLFVYGSEFKKGQASMTGAVEPEFISLTNKPIILKDHYEISGSDASQIGWIEVTGEGGQSGYLWYIKSEGDTRQRFEDYSEMALVEAEKKGTNGVVDVDGTEGLFAAIEDRGHQFDGFVGGTATESLQDFDLLLKKLDKEGAIEENMLFVNRDIALSIDDMLAAQNSYGAGGTSYGVFNNSEDMALNLGFSGFRRGSYDFYKTDWKYLNDASTRGLIGGIEGALIPAGTSSVYDQILGKNIKRPFLHVRYRASEADDRKMKSWITGSVGGAATSGDDKMEVHYLTERCLVVQGANNFVLFN